MVIEHLWEKEEYYLVMDKKQEYIWSGIVH